MILEWIWTLKHRFRDRSSLRTRVPNINIAADMWIKAVYQCQVFVYFSPLIELARIRLAWCSAKLCKEGLSAILMNTSSAGDTWTWIKYTANMKILLIVERGDKMSLIMELKVNKKRYRKDQDWYVRRKWRNIWPFIGNESEHITWRSRARLADQFTHQGFWYALSTETCDHSPEWKLGNVKYSEVDEIWTRIVELTEKGQLAEGLFKYPQMVLNVP